MKLNLEEYLNEMVELGKKAGEITLRYFRKVHLLQHKGEVDLVTIADEESESFLREELLKRFPSHKILGEEEGISGSEDSEFLWYIDPLDGTTNFAHGHPVYAISLALSYKGEVVVGLVHIPVLNWTYTAIKGRGAKLNNQPIMVSCVKDIGKALVATGFPYDKWTNPDDNLKETSVMVKRAQGFRRCGAATIDLCWVADGTYDGYWEKRLKPWDIAAGSLIVEEAGGLVTDIDGNKMELDKGKTIVATNGLIHDRFLSLLKS